MRWRIAAIVVLLGLVVSGVLGQLRYRQPPVSILPQHLGDGWPIAAPDAHGFHGSTLERAYAHVASDPAFKAARGLLIVRNGQLVAEAYFDGYGPNRRSNVKSVTKSVLSLLIGIAIDQGFITGADQPISDFFPELIAKNGDAHAGDITIAHMLTMQAGLEWQEHLPWFGIDKDPAGMYRAEDPVAYVLSKPMAGEPGNAFRYSTGTSQVLAGVLRQATGETPRDFAATHLFAPLGIHDVEWNAAKDGTSYGGVGLHLSPRELARIGQLMLQQGQWDGKTVVSAEWVADSTRGHALLGYDDGPYGYHWWVRPLGFTAQGARGQYVYVVPAEHLVVVLVAKSDGPRFVDLRAMDELIDDYVLPAIQR